MSELDLTEAIEAAADAIDDEIDLDVNVNRLAEAAVRAAAPIIERAVREAIAARMEAEFVAGNPVPEWAQAGGKATAAGIRRWAVGIARGEP